MRVKENTLQIPNWYLEELLNWEPPEQLRISEWAEKYRVLSEPAEEKGPLRLSRTPYMVPILDAFLDPGIETIVLCKSAQIAGTEGLLSILGYFAHQEPCSQMLVLADEDTALYMSRERVQKMFRASPALSRFIVEDRFNLNEISLANGAYIALGWASSIAKLASRPIKIMLFDEVDKPGYFRTTDEASAISLGIERTETFYNRKIAITSTPTTETGNIWKHLQACDVVFDWHVPCPQCNQYQPLRWSREHCKDFKDGLYRDHKGIYRQVGQVVWKGGRTASPDQIAMAGYQCGQCSAVWNTLEKNLAVERGMMVSRTEMMHPPKKVGFHVNRLYSLLGKSGDIPKLVDNWLRTTDDPKEKQGFINSALAEPWRQVIVTTSESEILKARCELPPQTVPPEAVALTCFIDVQKDGRWFVVRAFARDSTSWLIHYGLLPGWDDVESLLFDTSYPIYGSDQRMTIWRAAVDTGGGDAENGLSMTEDTYLWLQRNYVGKGCRIWGTKGSSNPLGGRIHIGKDLEKTPSGKSMPGGLRIILLDTAQLKEAFHHRLQLAGESMPQGAYLHSGTDQLYVSHISAEEKRRDKRGVEQWVKIRKRNDLLDCECGCLALADRQWPGGGVHLIGSAIRQQQPQPQRIQDNNMPWIQKPSPGWIRR